MKNTLIIFLLFAFSNSAYSLSYHKYENVRFDYEIKYPDVLMPQGEPDNNDGQKFTNSSSELIVWGSYGPPTIDESYQNAMDDLKDYKITYSTKKHDSFAISGYSATKIAYFRTIHKCGSNINFRLYYPKYEIKKWDSIVNKIIQSFHFISTTCENSEE